MSSKVHTTVVDEKVGFDLCPDRYPECTLEKAAIVDDLVEDVWPTSGLHQDASERIAGRSVWWKGTVSRLIDISKVQSTLPEFRRSIGLRMRHPIPTVGPEQVSGKTKV